MSNTQETPCRCDHCGREIDFDKQNHTSWRGVYWCSHRCADRALTERRQAEVEHRRTLFGGN